MWKCKSCGGTKFKTEIDGFVEIKLDQNGDYEYQKDTLIIKNDHAFIDCCQCYEYGEKINEIAEWIEE